MTVKIGRFHTPSHRPAWSRLISAIRDADENLVRQLIAEGININQLDARNFSPLSTAIYYNNLSIIKLLLENNCVIAHKKTLLKNFLLKIENQDHPDILFCLDVYYKHYPDDIEIRQRVIQINDRHEKIWKKTREILEDTTPLPTAVLNFIVKSYDSPLGRLSIFNNEEKIPEIKTEIPHNNIKNRSSCVIL